MWSLSKMQQPTGQRRLLRRRWKLAARKKRRPVRCLVDDGPISAHEIGRDGLRLRTGPESASGPTTISSTLET